MTFAKSLACAVLAITPPAMMMAQEQGYWRASSNTASTITGDLGLSASKLTINQFYTTPIAEIRKLTSAETSSVFDVPADSPIEGHLYRLQISGGHVFLHKNHLCGNSDVQWMAVRAEGKDLNVAFFSGSTPPVFERDAIANSTDLCGTFEYGR